LTQGNSGAEPDLRRIRQPLKNTIAIASIGTQTFEKRAGKDYQGAISSTGPSVNYLTPAVQSLRQISVPLRRPADFSYCLGTTSG